MRKFTKRCGWLKRLCSAAVVLVLVAASIQMFSIKTSAAEYEGKGTKANPYLVTNAEQLDGMRNKLSAHYKLANTIDMSGVANFQPIGNLKTPFTGSFTCDKNSDGTPKYIIKNLTVSISPKGSTLAEKYSGYKEDKSMGWEAALFGTAKNASFKNIVILDAKISSIVEGNSTMNGDWSINNGMDDQATAIFIAIAKSCTIESCGTSGTITTKSNHGAGLVGQLDGGSVKNSYSYANVSALGVWNTGGFIASAGGSSKISSCFFDGVYEGGATSCGAFIGVSVGENGKANATITDCWAGGTVKSSQSGCFYGTDSFSTHLLKNGKTAAEVVKNCYTTAKIEGFNGTPDETKLTNNNWIAAEKGGFEPSFKAGSMEDINAAFTSQSAWTVAAGSYPQLKNVHPVKDASAYVPGAVSEVTTDDKTAAENTDAADTTAAENGGEAEVTDEQLGGGGTNATIDLKVDQTMTKMSMTEKVLVIVLLAVFVILVIVGIWTIVAAHKLLGTQKPKKNKEKKVPYETVKKTGKDEKTYPV